MSFRRIRVAGSVVAAVLVVALAAPVAGAADPADQGAAARAVDWLVGQQEADGGFELADFPGFETPDAVLAIASAAQTGAAWSTAEARAAVEGLQAGGSGPTPIDALDGWAAGANAGEASKLLLLVVAPLGLEPSSFGPSGTDLATVVYPGGCGSSPDTSGLFFQEVMFVAFGGEILCGAPDAAVLQTIRDAQRPEGGWNFNGSTDPVDPNDPFDPNVADVDSTALAVQALVAGGASWEDPAVLRALAYLAGAQAGSGAFPSFGNDDPTATAVARLAIAAAGFDPNASCWRDTAVPAAAGTPYAAPAGFLRARQQPDGHVASPNDGYGVNSFATSQSVDALLRSWLPMARAADAPTCPEVSPDAATREPADPADPADPVVLSPRFTG